VKIIASSLKIISSSLKIISSPLELEIYRKTTLGQNRHVELSLEVKQDKVKFRKQAKMLVFQKKTTARQPITTSLK